MHALTLVSNKSCETYKAQGGDIPGGARSAQGSGREVQSRASVGGSTKIAGENIVLKGKVIISVEKRITIVK